MEISNSTTDMNTNNQREQQLWSRITKDLYANPNPLQRKKHRIYASVLQFYTTNRPINSKDGPDTKGHEKQ